MTRSTALAGALLALTALTACGSTVPQAGQALTAGPADAALGGGLTEVPGAAAPGAVAQEPGAPAAVEPGTPVDVGGASAPLAPAAGAPAPGAPARTRTATTAGAPTRAAAPAARAGGPRVTAPVRVGFVNTKVGNAESAGLDVGQTASTEKVFRTLVTALNAQGGLAGRRIEPLTADTDTAGGDWNSDFQAACERLTKDQEAEVVLGYVFATLDSFENCLLKAGVPHLSGAYTVGDEQTLRDFPTLVGTNTLTADRRYRLQLEGAVREGYLTKASKIGIIADECPSTRRAFKNTVEPYLKANDLYRGHPSHAPHVHGRRR